MKNWNCDIKSLKIFNEFFRRIKKEEKKRKEKLLWCEIIEKKLTAKSTPKGKKIKINELKRAVERLTQAISFYTFLLFKEEKS